MRATRVAIYRDAAKILRKLEGLDSELPLVDCESNGNRCHVKTVDYSFHPLQHRDRPIFLTHPLGAEIPFSKKFHDESSELRWRLDDARTVKYNSLKIRGYGN